MGPITIEEIREKENFVSWSRNKVEVINQSDAMNESLEKIDEKLSKLMTMVERNSDNFDQLNEEVTNLKKDMHGKFDDMKRIDDDLQTLKKNVMVPKENVPDEDLSSLGLELKSCIKSYRSIEKDNQSIKGKLHKVYGRNFFDR